MQSPPSKYLKSDAAPNDTWPIPFEMTTEQSKNLKEEYGSGFYTGGVDNYYQEYSKYTLPLNSIINIPFTSGGDEFRSYVEDFLKKVADDVDGPAKGRSEVVDVFIDGTIVRDDHDGRFKPDHGRQVEALSTVANEWSKLPSDTFTEVYVHFVYDNRLTPFPHPMMLERIGSKYRFLPGAGLIPAGTPRVVTTFKLAPKKYDPFNCERALSDDSCGRAFSDDSCGRSFSEAPCGRSFSEAPCGRSFSGPPPLSEIFKKFKINKYVAGRPGTSTSNFEPLPPKTTLRSLGITSKHIPDDILDAEILTAEGLVHIIKVLAAMLNIIFFDRNPALKRVKALLSKLSLFLNESDLAALKAVVEPKLADDSQPKVSFSENEARIVAKLQIIAFLNIGKDDSLTIDQKSKAYKKIAAAILLKEHFFKLYENKPYDTDALRPLTCNFVSWVMAMVVAFRYSFKGDLKKEIDDAAEYDFTIMEAIWHDGDKEKDFSGFSPDTNWGGVVGGVGCVNRPGDFIHADADAKKCGNAFGEGIRIVVDAMQGEALPKHQDILRDVGFFSDDTAAKWGVKLFNLIVDQIAGYELPAPAA